MAKASYTRYDAEMSSVEFQINHWLSHSRLVDRHRVAVLDRRAKTMTLGPYSGPERRINPPRRRSDRRSYEEKH